MKPDRKQKKKAIEKKISRVADIKSNADNYRSKGQLEQEIIEQEKKIQLLKKVFEYSISLLGYSKEAGPDIIYKRLTGKSWLKSSLELSNEDHKEALFRLVIASINFEYYKRSIFRRIRFYKYYKEAKKAFVNAEKKARKLIGISSLKGIKENDKKEIKQDTK